MTAEERVKHLPTSGVRWALLLVLLVMAVVLGVGLAQGHSSYNDGYQWGEANTIGILSKTAPSCSQSEMVSSGEVNDSNFIFNKPEGDNEPKDNYVKWQAGCEAAARSVIANFNS